LKGKKQVHKGKVKISVRSEDRFQSSITDLAALPQGFCWCRSCRKLEPEQIRMDKSST